MKSDEQHHDGESSKDTNNGGKQSTKRKDVSTGKGEAAGNGEAKAKARRRKETVERDEQMRDDGEEGKPEGSAPQGKRRTPAEIDPNVLEQACCTCCRGNGCYMLIKIHAYACLFSSF